MPTEEPISQNEESEQNTYPGIDPKKSEIVDNANKAYSAYKAPDRIRNTKKRLKNYKEKAKKYGRKGAQAVRKGAQAVKESTQVAKIALEWLVGDIPLISSNPFSTKAISSTPKFVSRILRVTTSFISKLGGLISIKVVLIAIVLFVILKIIGVLGTNTYSSQQLTSSGPVFAKIGDKLDYTITLDYPGAAKDVIITDKIPAGTEYVNAPNASYDPAANTVTWNIPATTSATLSLTLLATKDNNYIINILKGKVLGEVEYNPVENEVLGENDSLPASKTDPLLTPQLSSMAYPLTPKFNLPNTTPTVFQLAPTNIPISPRGANVIKSCVITKIGEPVVIPSLPPECQ